LTISKKLLLTQENDKAGHRNIMDRFEKKGCANINNRSITNGVSGVLLMHHARSLIPFDFEEDFLFWEH
jgi:hypothetical protein